MKSPLSKEVLLNAYRKMRTIRSFEDRMHAEFAGGAVPGFVHLYAGQEASAVGVCAHLSDEDYLAGTHRGHGHAIAKGVPAEKVLLEIYGRADGVCGGFAGSCHVHDTSVKYMGANSGVGSGAALACGAALTAKTKTRDAIAVALIGEGAANQGVVSEAMNLASVWQLPVLFVFENNGYAEATAADWAIAGDLWKRGEAFGMPGVCVEGHDFFAVVEAVAPLIARARKRQGPGVLEVRQKRFYGHFEGDAQTYRGADEVELLRSQRDCLTNFASTATSSESVSRAELSRIDVQIEEMVESIYRTAPEAEMPSADRLDADIYASDY